MRGAVAKARRLRVLGRGSSTLEPAYERAVEAREAAEGRSMCCVLTFILALITFRRAAPRETQKRQTCSEREARVQRSAAACARRVTPACSPLTRCARSVLYIVRENDTERSLLHAASLGARGPRRAGHGVLSGVLTDRFGFAGG